MDKLGHNPLIIPLSGITVGILLDNLNLPLWGAVVPIALALIIYILITHRSTSPLITLKLNRYHNIWIALLFIGIGMLSAFSHRPTQFDIDNEILPPFANATVINSHTTNIGEQLTLEITSFEDFNQNKTDVCNLKITAITDHATLNIGDIIKFPLKLRPISPDRNSLYDKNFSKIFKHKGIIYHQNIDGNKIEVIGHKRSLQSEAAKIRDFLIINLDKSSLSTSATTFISTILLGDSSELTYIERAKFADAGISHILALSGLHIAIIAAILSILLSPLNLITDFRIHYFVIIIVLWIYAITTGLSPSVTRATLMASFYYGAKIFQRNSSALNSLCAAIILILIIDPLTVYDIGLQLSFTCVAALICFANKLNTIDQHNHPYLYKINSSLLNSLIAVAASWALVAYYFNRIPLLFIPLNIIILPILPIYIAIAALYLLLLTFGIDINILSILLNSGISALQSIVTFTASGSSITLNIPQISVIIWSITLIILAIAIHNNSKQKLLYPLGLLTTTIAIMPLFLNKNTYDNCFIIQNKYTQNSIAIYNSGNEKVMKLPDSGIYVFKIGNKSLAWINDNQLPSNNKQHINYLIIGKQYNKNIDLLLKYYTPDTIVIATNVYHTKVDNLINESNYLKTPVYSLLQQGPLFVK
jgi:competence protein ComEC